MRRLFSPLVLALSLSIALPSLAEAAVQNFFARTEGTGTRFDPYRPTGVDDLPAGTQWLSYSWGPDWFLVHIEATNAVLNAYGALTDVRSIPRNLNNQVGANLSAVQALMDELGMPSDWPTSGMTYAEVLRVMWTMLTLGQRLQGMFDVDLYVVLADFVDTPWVDIDPTLQQQLRDAADSLEMNYQMVQVGWSLGRAFYEVAQTYAQAPWGE